MTDDHRTAERAETAEPDSASSATSALTGGLAPDGLTRRQRRRLRKRNESVFDRRFVPTAKWLLAHGVHPNHFTFLQIPVFAFTILAAVEGWNWPFALTTVFVMILDGGDGILARVGNLQSRTGAILDAVFDLLGIALILWGCTKFFPEAEAWIMLLLLANGLLFLQNALLGDKAVSYIRGPMVGAVAFPQVLPAALVVCTFTVGFLLIVRAKRSWKALVRAGLLS
ncbi:MAG: CDP-alcohol phosphatidyltransferase family protein [Candidatus Thermoplasmatota archaeon]|jgi:phosphatidylglycerophosphate synthase